MSDRDLTYETDEWSKHAWGKFHEAYGNDPEVSQLTRDAKRRNPTYPTFMRETFARLYDTPTEVPADQRRPEDKWSEVVHNELGSSPEFQRLQGMCAHDRVAAGHAATVIGREMLEHAPKLGRDVDDIRKEVKNTIDRAKKAQLIEEGKAAVKAATEAAAAINPADVHADAYLAVEAAIDAVEEVQNGIRAFSSFGSSEYMPDDSMPDDERAELARAIESSPKLKRIAEMAGRLSAIASEKQRTKADHARSEVVGVTVGNDLDRVLPSDLMLLAEPSLRMEFFRKYIERGLLCYDISGKEPQEKGPIVVCIDQSGSMDEGDRDVWAKAFALALAKIAGIQKRRIAIIMFDHTLIGEVTWKGEPNTSELLATLGRSPRGGTDFGPPLMRALALMHEDETLRKADVIMITDGECYLSPERIDEWNDARRTLEASCYGILVGSASVGGLAEIASKVIHVSNVANDLASHDVFEI